MIRQIKVEDSVVTDIAFSIKIFKDYIEEKDLNIVLGSVLDENGSFTPPVFNFNAEEEKLILKKHLWSLLPQKIIASKKHIIGKYHISDEELKALLNVYENKYNDAVAGLEVFKAQATIANVSQADFRAIVIAKGDAFKFAEKEVNDLIETVRQVMEDKIDALSTVEERDIVVEKMSAIDKFSILTPLGEIMEILNG